MGNDINIEITIAGTKEEFDAGAALFRGYAASIDIDLGFQGFEKELADVAKQYSKPTGALLLAHVNGHAATCAGIRRIDDDIAELKRMYVQPAYRGHKIAKQLLALALQTAASLHYKAIRLDTIPSMIQAQALYLSQGFYTIPPYRYNPVEGAIYMEKKLG